MVFWGRRGEVRDEMSVCSVNVCFADDLSGNYSTYTIPPPLVCFTASPASLPPLQPPEHFPGFSKSRKVFKEGFFRPLSAFPNFSFCFCFC